MLIICNIQFLFFFERRLILWIDCLQFFYIIFAISIKYRDVNKKHYHLITDC